MQCATQTIGSTCRHLNPGLLATLTLGTLGLGGLLGPVVQGVDGTGRVGLQACMWPLIT